MLWWGARTLGAGSVLWYQGISRSTGATAAAFMGLMPVSSLLLSYILLNEPFHFLHLIGFGLVLLGIILISSSHIKGDK